LCDGAALIFQRCHFRVERVAYFASLALVNELGHVRQIGGAAADDLKSEPVADKPPSQKDYSF
jgi:hypothetical protein